MGTEVLPKSEEAVPAEAPSSLEQQIIRQIEYYFGNFNLSRDKFLREQLKVDDGWVPLETLVKFNRLKKLSEDFNVIVGALKKSPKQLMEVSEDCTKIRRHTAAPAPEEYAVKQKEHDKRTLYVKGFKRTNTLDELLEFFKDYNVENIHMKKVNYQNNKPFKGSVFVTFETREDAEKFLETKGIKYNGVDLLKEWKTDYNKRKDELYDRLRAEKEKKILRREQEKAKEQEDGKKAAENEMVPGCLLKIVNLNEDTMREHIQEVFEPHGTIVYVDYSRGKSFAVLRFKGEAKSVLENVLKDGETVKIGSSEATVTVIEGEEEKDYWENIAILKAQKRKNNKTNNRGNRNFQNKKRKWDNQRGRKRGKNENDKDDEIEQSRKQMKVEASETTVEKDSTTEPPQKKIKVEASEVNDIKDSNGVKVNAGPSKAEVEPQQES